MVESGDRKFLHHYEKMGEGVRARGGGLNIRLQDDKGGGVQNGNGKRAAYIFGWTWPAWKLKLFQIGPSFWEGFEVLRNIIHP